MPGRWWDKNLMGDFEWQVDFLDKIKLRARLKGLSKRQAFILGLAAIVFTAVVVLGIAGMIILS